MQQTDNVTCNECNAVFESFSTGTLKRHYEKFHKKQKVDEVKAKSQQEFETYLLKWVVGAQLPFTVVEYPEFKNLISYLDDSLNLPSADKIKTLLQTNINSQTEKLKLRFLALNKIQLQIDVCQSKFLSSFIGITQFFKE